MCDPTKSSWGFGGRCKPPGGVRGRAPEANAFWQQSIENWLEEIRSLGRRLHPNYSNILENMISSSMYDTISYGEMI